MCLHRCVCAQRAWGCAHRCEQAEGVRVCCVSGSVGVCARQRCVCAMCTQVCARHAWGCMCVHACERGVCACVPVACHGVCAHLSSVCVHCVHGVFAGAGRVCAQRAWGQAWGGVHMCEQAAYGCTERAGVRGGVLCVYTRVCARTGVSSVCLLCEYSVHGGVGAHTCARCVCACWTWGCVCTHVCAGCVCVHTCVQAGGCVLRASCV